MDEYIRKYASPDNKINLYNGNCMDVLKKIENETVSLVITSPPYCIGKEYEDINDDINSFKRLNTEVIRESTRILKKGGSLCWQVGFHVKNSVVVPLHYL